MDYEEEEQYEEMQAESQAEMTFNFLGKNICFLRKLLLTTSISTNAGQFLSTKLAEVLIVMNFGDGFRVKLSMASSHLGAATFIIQLFS